MSVLSETWLKFSITNNSINIEGYSVFRIDRVNKGGGVYAKSSLNCSCVESVTKHFELLLVKLQLPNSVAFTVVGAIVYPQQGRQLLLHLWTICLNC